MRRAALLSVVLAICGSTARAQSSDEAFQLVVIPGAPQVNDEVIRLNIATGETAVSDGGQALRPISDPSPLPPSVYRLYAWHTFDSTGTNLAWTAYRFDVDHGDLWVLRFDPDSKAGCWIKNGAQGTCPGETQSRTSN
jgi:hypothetical protein